MVGGGSYHEGSAFTPPSGVETLGKRGGKTSPQVFGGIIPFPHSGVDSSSSCKTQTAMCKNQVSDMRVANQIQSICNVSNVCSVPLRKLRRHWSPLTFISSMWDDLRFLAQYSSIWVTWRGVTEEEQVRCRQHASHHFSACSGHVSTHPTTETSPLCYKQMSTSFHYHLCVFKIAA